MPERGVHGREGCVGHEDAHLQGRGRSRCVRTHSRDHAHLRLQALMGRAHSIWNGV